MATSVAAEERLRAIRAITDAALSQLEYHDFLTELLERAREILQADTAAVLLLDSEAGELVATAAAGLEEEVRQGVRIPMGRGFAGRIATERRPVILDRVDHTTVLNPILLEKGIRSMIGVPMITGGRMVGVLHVGSLTSRVFTAQDTDLLQLAAGQAAGAVLAMLAREDRSAAAALQRSLMPPGLLSVAGAELSARYVPGHGAVGGDWYDVFSLPGGELCVVIGDAAGSGLPAAVSMGRMRTALRAYALQTADPAEILVLLDRNMHHFERGALGTALCAVLSPGLGQAVISSAGHPPPVIALPGEPAELVAIPADLMIGVDASVPRHTTAVALPPGCALCLYTDGLVERPGEPIDEGLSRLCQAVTPGPANNVCASVMSALVGGEQARDDIALLVIWRQPADATGNSPRAGPARPPA